MRYTEAVHQAAPKKGTTATAILKQVDAAVGVEVRQAMERLLHRVWDEVAWDVLDAAPRRQLPGSTVREVVLDQAEAQLAGMRLVERERDAYQWWQALTLWEQEAVARAAFTDKWYGI